MESNKSISGEKTPGITEGTIEKVKGIIKTKSIRVSEMKIPMRSS